MFDEVESGVAGVWADMDAFVIVEVAPHKVALPAREVEQVLRMAALTPVPRGNGHVDGTLDLHGEIVPVVSLRAWLGVPRRDPSPDDHLVVLRQHDRRIALVVDRVVDLAIVEADALVASAWSEPGVISGAVKLPAGIAVVPQLDALAADASR